MFRTRATRREWLKTATMVALCPWIQLKDRPNDRILNPKLAAFVEAQDDDWVIDGCGSSFNSFNVHFPEFHCTDAPPMSQYAVSLYPDYVELDSRWLSAAVAARVMRGMPWHQQSRLQTYPHKEFHPRIFQITDPTPDALLRIVRLTCSRLRDVFSRASQESDNVEGKASLDEVVIELVASAAMLGHADLKFSSPFGRAACKFNGWSCDWERRLNAGVVTLLSKSNNTASTVFESVMIAKGNKPTSVNTGETIYSDVSPDSFQSAIFAAYRAEAENDGGLSEYPGKLGPRTFHVQRDRVSFAMSWQMSASYLKPEAIAMKNYQATITPRGSSTPHTVSVQASSLSEAKKIAQLQYPQCYVSFVREVR